MSGDVIERAKAALEGVTIRDCPNYVATPDGSVWSVGHNWRGYGERRVTPVINRYGYLKIRLTQDGRRRNFPVAKIICEAFHGPRPTADHQIRHLNGVKTDNRAENLNWGTPTENAADRDRHGTTVRGGDSPHAKLTPELVLDARSRAKAGAPVKPMARELGVSQKTLINAITGKTWAHVR